MATNGSVTVRDILTYHNMERQVFERLLRLGRDRESAKNITFLWMWMERVGFDDLIQKVRDSNDNLVLRFVREAESMLDVLQQDAPPPGDNPRAIPLSGTLIGHPLSLRFFYVNRDMIIQGMAEFMDGVGRVIFNDSLRALMSSNPNAAALSRRFERAETSPEHLRTMFIMFTRGYPVGRDQIVEYFTSRWGDCIDRAVVETTTPGVMPMYGRVVFRTASYLELALNRQQQTEFVVNGRQLWGLRPMINGLVRR